MAARSAQGKTGRRPRRSIFVGRMLDWDPRLEYVFRGISRLGGDVAHEMWLIARAGGLPGPVQDALRMFTGHVLNCALAACSPIIYAYRFSPEGQVVLDACAPLRLFEQGREYVLDELKKDLATASRVQNGAGGSGPPAAGTT